MANSLATRAGEQCPEGEDTACGQRLHHRDHGSPSSDGVQAAGPVEELICPIHGIVESR